MTAMRCLVLVTMVTGAAAMEVTPIDKVITLIQGMKDDVEKEGKAEAGTYGKFACFCKTTTTAKSTSVKDGNDKIDSLSADIADKTQSKKKDSTELAGRKQKQEGLSADLDSTTARCAKEKAEYEAEAADLNKAISSLKNAIKSMKDGGHKGAAFLQGSTQEDLMQTLAMANAMGLVDAPKRKEVTSMIQGKASVDPSDPDYKYHSNDIVDLLVKLDKDFKAEKASLDSEYNKAKKACDEMKASLKKEMGTNSDAMKALSKNIQKLAKEIAAHRGDLVTSEEQMKDDELYLKDLTARCESRANDWDQRSAMRNDELSALAAALKVLKGNVKGAADDVNKRALLQRLLSKPEVAPAAVSKPVASKATAASKPVSASKPVKASQPVQKPISFLQGSLRKGVSMLSNEAKQAQALALLVSEGDRLGSLVLTTLATRSAADPFVKVKGLIQKLIERLIAEATAEATKKGFCDTELGKARKDRDFRREETQDLSTDLETLEAKRDALVEEIKSLTKNIAKESEVLKETLKERKEEKEENLKTLGTAKDGLDAVREALLILKVFYKEAAKSFVQASPVDEDTEGAGFSGNYKGQQSGAHAVFALLETIESDFDRTLRKTESAESEAAREFVEFNQAAQASIASQTTKKELDEQDLKTTRTSLKTKMEDLQTAQKLLDDALKELETLKPTCIDTGMSYKDRVAKREEEMAALKKALCILDANNVEAECQKGKR